jgi:hypothetical protein
MMTSIQDVNKSSKSERTVVFCPHQSVADRSARPPMPASTQLRRPPPSRTPPTTSARTTPCTGRPRRSLWRRPHSKSAPSPYFRAPLPLSSRNSSVRRHGTACAGVAWCIATPAGSGAPSPAPFRPAIEIPDQEGS